MPGSHPRIDLPELEPQMAGGPSAFDAWVARQTPSATASSLLAGFDRPWQAVLP